MKAPFFPAGPCQEVTKFSEKQKKAPFLKDQSKRAPFAFVGAYGFESHQFPKKQFADLLFFS